MVMAGVTALPWRWGCDPDGTWGFCGKALSSHVQG